MADIDISAVSAVYTGTPESDNFTRSTGNLKDITVLGLSGDDTLALGSAVQNGTGAGGVGLGFSLASSTILMGDGEDIYTFSGQAGSGFARQNQTLVEMGGGNDFALINGLASASGATVKANDGDDEIGFVAAAGANTAFRTLIEGNVGNDLISATWTGAVTENFEVYGGQGNDTISALFSNVRAYSAATAFVSGVYVAGGKGADQVDVDTNTTSEAVVVATNSGTDTLNFQAFDAISGVQLFGGEGDDVISAALGSAGGARDTFQAVSVAGGRGNDSASLVAAASAGGNYSGVQLLGGSGNDVLSFSAATASTTTAGTANGVFGGSGSDTINVKLDGLVRVQGASGFVADLGSEVSGGIINVNVSGAGNLQGAAVFRGSTGADTIALNSLTGGDISGASIAGNAGADVIGIRGADLAATLVATRTDGGAGADTITATLAGAGGYFGTAGEGNVLDGGDDSDVIAINLATAAVVTGVSVAGGAGADSITVNYGITGGAIASRANTAGNNFSIKGDSGADVIGLVANVRSAAANAEVLGGTGNDTITATFLSNSAVAISAGGGLGADSIAFLTQGSAGTFAGSVLAGNSGADTISVTFSGRKTVDPDFGVIAGGTGADSMIVNLAGVGGTAGFAGTALFLNGTFDAGQGADSISVLGLTGNVNNQLTGSNIQLASGDSLVGGFDTYFFQTTAGNGALTGVSASFSGFANNAFAKAASLTTAGRFTASFTGGKGAFVSVGITGGLATFKGSNSAGGINSAGSIAVRAGAGSTTADIISAIDRVAIGVNSIAAFNIQDGSAGTVNGYLFIQGGVNPDTVVRLNGIRQVNTGGLASADLVFRGPAGNFTVTNAGGGGSGGITFDGAL